MKTRLVVVASLLFIFSCTGRDQKNDNYVLSETDRKEISSVLQSQQEAWNAGDLDGFMEGYWKSEKLAFVGVQGPTYGYNKTLERYKK